MCKFVKWSIRMILLGAFVMHCSGEAYADTPDTYPEVAESALSGEKEYQGLILQMNSGTDDIVTGPSDAVADGITGGSADDTTDETTGSPAGFAGDDTAGGPADDTADGITGGPADDTTDEMAGGPADATMAGSEDTLTNDRTEDLSKDPADDQNDHLAAASADHTTDGLADDFENDPTDDPEGDPSDDPEPEATIGKLGASVFESGNRIWFYNVAGGLTNAEFIIVESDGHWGIIDAGHRYSPEPLVDSDGTEYEVPFYYEDGTLAGFSIQAEGRNGRDAALYMIETLGASHLDFIIGTHGHSDHSGGIPDVAGILVEDEEGLHPFVDAQTVYIHKTYQHVSPLNDDLGEEKNEQSWHNQAYVYQAEKSVADQGGQVVDISHGLITGNVMHEAEQEELDYSEILAGIEAGAGISDVVYDQRELNDYFDDYIAFQFGDFNIRLYNLYSIYKPSDENTNCIVTVISDGKNAFYSGADLDATYLVQQRVANAVYADYGHIDMVKTHHHGVVVANTREFLDLFQPSVSINVSWRSISDIMANSYAAGIHYSGKHYGTVYYEVGSSDKGLVVEFGEEGLELKQLFGEGTEASFGSPENCINQSPVQEGWAEWITGKYAGTLSDFLYFIENEPVTGWMELEEGTFFFDEDGFMLRGWLEDQGETYYFRNDGTMLTGWKKVEDGYFYFSPETGASVHGWVADDTGTYFLLLTQQLLTGFHMIDGEGYFFRENGAMKTGWVETEDGWRFFDELGRMLDGMTGIDGKTYYLENGILTTGWAQVEDSTYWIGSDGAVVTGWQQIGSGIYYFGEDGCMVTGWFRVDGTWFHSAESGRREDGWFTDESGTYYLDGEYGLQKGWLSLGENTYYLGTSGKMVTGWKYLAGDWHFFNEKGVMVKGWFRTGGAWYFADRGGCMRTGWQKIGKRWYFFRSDGRMKTGWIRSEGQWLYLNETDGFMTTGWKQIGEDWYYFEKSGFMVTGSMTINGKTWEFREDGTLIQE